MDIEGMREASWEDQKNRLNTSESFHMDPSKAIDPIEKLLEDLGPTGAFDELMDRLDKNPNDAETRRQASLLVNRFEDLAGRLRVRIQH
ncbi:hypothetical protein KGQ72_02870 [Patescibacteria group bacterium]|nr:hypothetical protein [Patescibacteria group bacterium]